jgi:hypothetical protein
MDFHNEADFDTDGDPRTNETVDGVFTVTDADGWTRARTAIGAGGNNKNYIINVGGAVTGISGVTGPSFGAVTGITVSMRGQSGGAAARLALGSAGSLLHIGSGQTLILRNIELRGITTNTAALVHVDGGALAMHSGAVITGNTNTAGPGGGLYLDGGTFTKTGNSVIYGSDETGFDGNGNPLRNISFGSGHAVYTDSTHFRNTAVTPAETLALSGSDYTGVWYDYDVPSGGAVILVGTAAELAAIAGDITDSAKNNSANAYVLTADIDLGGYGPWTPIGQVGTVDSNGQPTGGLEPFTGYFYGKGRRILGLELPGGSIYKIGLFGYTDGARIQDLVVELKPVSITLSLPSAALTVGGIAGWGEDTRILNCAVYSTGTITVTGNTNRNLAIGGIAGCLRSSSSVRNSYTALNADVTFSTTHLGIAGICAGGDNFSIENCYFAGTITGNNTGANNFVIIGGIATDQSSVQNSYAAGTLSNTNGGASYSATGGIYAGMSKSVKNSAALVSAVSDTSNRLGRIHNHQTSGSSTVVLTNNYAWSGMTVNGNPVSDDATDPQNTLNGLGKSAGELKTRSTYETGLGWDFTNVWEMGPASYPYPIFKWQKGVVYIPAGFTVLP